MTVSLSDECIVLVFIKVVGPNSPENGVPGEQRSIPSSGELKGALGGPLTWWILWTGYCVLFMASMGQHSLQIKLLSKGNNYLSSMRSVSYLSCHLTYAYVQGVILVNLIISITFHYSSFPVCLHMSV